jgi:hypothetical protein
MNDKHKKLVELAEAAIREVHGDTSVTQEETLASLEDLRSTISIMIQGVEDDLSTDDAS